MRAAAIAAIATLMVLCAPRIASAHKPSDSHVAITVHGDAITGAIAVAVRDLDGALAVDADGNGQITWAETRAAGPRIADYIAQRLAIRDCELTFGDGSGALVEFSDGAYWVAPITGRCATAPDAIAVTYRLLQDIDAQHRAIVRVVGDSGAGETRVIRDPQPQTFDLDADSPRALALAGVEAAASSPLTVAAMVVVALAVIRARRGPREAASHYAAFALAAAATMMAVLAGAVDLPLAVVTIARVALVALAVVSLRTTRTWTALFELGLAQGIACAAWLRIVDRGEPTATAALAYALGFALACAAVAALATTAALVLRSAVWSQPKRRRS